MSADRKAVLRKAGLLRSLGLACLVLGLLGRQFAPHLRVGPVAATDFAVGLLLGLAIALMILALVKQKRAGKAAAPSERC